MRRLLTLSLFLFPLGALAFGGAPAERDASGRFLLAGDVPEEQRMLLRKDFELLRELQIETPDDELARVLELERADGPALGAWLGDRVRVLVGETFDVAAALVTLAESHVYENPYVFPNIERYPAPHASQPGTPPRRLVVMSNLGASLYLRGKSERRLYGLTIPGAGVEPIRSPRAGILQVGKGYFFLSLERLGARNSEASSEVYSLYRLATLFHEARHSDGNEESLGFLHALCPPDHDYAHTYSCDRNLNGPYRVGALVTRSFLANCKTCTAAEQEALRLEALDSFSRVIERTEDPRYVSADKSMHEVCEALWTQNRILNDTAPLPEVCKPPNGGEGVIHSTYWDARPEGTKQEPR